MNFRDFLISCFSYSHQDRHFKRSSAFEPLMGGGQNAGYHSNLTNFHDTRSLTSLKSDPYRFYYTIDRRLVLLLLARCAVCCILAWCLLGYSYSGDMVSLDKKQCSFLLNCVFWCQVIVS